MCAHVERLEFQAEARQLLELLVHSVNSHKGSFLCELISNSSDALDKLRLETMRNKDLNADASDLHIQIEAGDDPRTLTVGDNGIGMTHDELARMYRASGQQVPVGKRILEINPGHPLITTLQQARKSFGNGSAELAETAELLYGTALLAEGGELDDPAKFATLLADRLARTV